MKFFGKDVEISRRNLLKAGALVTGGTLLAACAPQTLETPKSTDLGKSPKFQEGERLAKIESYKRNEAKRRLDLVQKFRDELTKIHLNVVGVFPYDIEKEMHFKIDTGKENLPVNFRTSPDLANNSTLFARDNTHAAAGSFEGFPNGSRTPESQLNVKIQVAPGDEATFAVFKLRNIDDIVAGDLKTMTRGQILNIEGEEYIFACTSRGKVGQNLGYMKEDSQPVNWDQKIQ